MSTVDSIVDSLSTQSNDLRHLVHSIAHNGSSDELNRALIVKLRTAERDLQAVRYTIDKSLWR